MSRLARPSGLPARCVMAAFAAIVAAAALFAGSGVASEPVVLAGPAMGTTYRVTLAAAVPGRSRGDVHRELEAVLARIDRGASSWRPDSDVSRFNRAAAGEWVEVGDDLSAILSIAREVHAETAGAFDPTVGPLVALWRQASERRKPPQPDALAAAAELVGLSLIEHRQPPAGSAALRKRKPGVALDLGGIGPGYAVDCLGERLVELGSPDHLVVLGGEARAWGRQASGERWQVIVPQTAGAAPATLPLSPGEAIAFATPRPGRSPIDPRTGQPVAAEPRPVMVRSTSCSRADALAVAAAVGAIPQ